MNTTINHKPASRIVIETADALIDFFAGRDNVTWDEFGAALEGVYANRNRKSAFGSYANVIVLLERRGAVTRYTGPNYTGDCFWDFTVVI